MLTNEPSINGYCLEICANSSESAQIAQASGASRVELCQNLELGGTTPSYGLIKRTREQLSIGVHVLIRPRAGDFLYTEAEFEEMKADILQCKALNCDGVVIGVLNAQGEVDLARNGELVALAEPMTCVFHRAFDRCADPYKSMEDIIALGFSRILTSGQRNTAEQGQQLIQALITKAAGRIDIMPGAGVEAANIATILKHTKARSIHSSAKVTLPSQMLFCSADLSGMNEATFQTDAARVAELVAQLQALEAAE